MYIQLERVSVPSSVSLLTPYVLGMMSDSELLRVPEPPFELVESMASGQRPI